MMTDILVAFAFLTRIPINHKDEVSLHRSARWFPLVGLLVGSIVGSTYFLASKGLPPLPSATLAILVGVLVCGGFHQDGLADVADGLVGGWDPEQRLKILKDSRHGTYGVLALVLQIILQISLLQSLSPIWGMFASICAFTLSKLGPVYLMMAKAAPTSAGMGASYSREITPLDIGIASVIAVASSTVLVGWLTLPLLFALVISNVGLLAYAKRKIGGVVGDVLGASEQLSESVILLLLVLFALHGHYLPRFL
jgi:adenosylcobinamide-GDP ribazoletransferase